MTKRSIVHVEIPAANRDASAKFYADLFGWNFQHMEQPSPYTTFEAGNTGGGYPDLGEMYKPGDVIIYISSDNLEADLKEIEKRGGKGLSPVMEVPGFGALVFFADPTGNRLALWKGNQNGG